MRSTRSQRKSIRSLGNERQWDRKWNAKYEEKVRWSSDFLFAATTMLPTTNVYQNIYWRRIRKNTFSATASGFPSLWSSSSCTRFSYIAQSFFSNEDSISYEQTFEPHEVHSHTSLVCEFFSSSETSVFIGRRIEKNFNVDLTFMWFISFGVVFFWLIDMCRRLCDDRE